MKSRFIKQLEQSCEELNEAFEKEVEDLSDGGLAAEKIVYDSIPVYRVGTDTEGNDSMQCILVRELKMAVELIYNDPALEALFQIRQNGDTTIAELSETESSRLRKQHWVQMPDQGPIRYLYTELISENWLYESNFKIAVHFDDQGRYQSHQMEMQSAVSMVDAGFHTLIRANMKSNE